MSDITEHLKKRLSPAGDLDVVPIGWRSTTMQSAYFYKEYVDRCIEELDKVILRQQVGQEPNPLEALAIKLLLSSAYFDTFDELQKALNAVKSTETNAGEDHEIR